MSEFVSQKRLDNMKAKKLLKKIKDNKESLVFSRVVPKRDAKKRRSEVTIIGPCHIIDELLYKLIG